MFSWLLSLVQTVTNLMVLLSSQHMCCQKPSKGFYVLIGAVLAGAVINADSPLRQSAHMNSLVEVSTRFEAAIDHATTRLEVQSQQVVTQLWPTFKWRLPGACCLPTMMSQR